MNLTEVIVAIFILLILSTSWNSFVMGTLREVSTLHQKEKALLERANQQNKGGGSSNEVTSRIYHP